MLNRFLFLLIISCSLGFAHSLKVFAKPSDDTLEIKGYYYGGSACKGCVVELRDENGAFASLKLDEQGRANTVLPNKISFKIAVIAAGGHLKEIEFKNPNFAQNQPNNSSKNPAPLTQNTQNTQNTQKARKQERPDQNGWLVGTLCRHGGGDWWGVFTGVRGSRGDWTRRGGRCR